MTSRTKALTLFIFIVLIVSGCSKDDITPSSSHSDITKLDKDRITNLARKAGMSTQDFTFGKRSIVYQDDVILSINGFESLIKHTNVPLNHYGLHEYGQKEHALHKQKAVSITNAINANDVEDLTIGFHNSVNTLNLAQGTNFIAAYQDAIANWSNVPQSDITLSNIGESTFADIVIFADNAPAELMGSPDLRNLPASTCGRATFPENGTAGYGISINDNVFRFDQFGNAQQVFLNHDQLVTLITHEIGHNLGFHHFQSTVGSDVKQLICTPAEDNNSVMRGESCTATVGLSDFDRIAANMLYPTGYARPIITQASYSNSAFIGPHFYIRGDIGAPSNTNAIPYRVDIIAREADTGLLIDYDSFPACDLASGVYLILSEDIKSRMTHAEITIRSLNYKTDRTSQLSSPMTVVL